MPGIIGVAYFSTTPPPLRPSQGSPCSSVVAVVVVGVGVGGVVVVVVVVAAAAAAAVVVVDDVLFGHPHFRLFLLFVSLGEAFSNFRLLLAFWSRFSQLALRSVLGVCYKFRFVLLLLLTVLVRFPGEFWCGFSESLEFFVLPAFRVSSLGCKRVFACDFNHVCSGFVLGFRGGLLFRSPSG